MDSKTTTAPYNLAAKRHATRETAILEIQGKIEKIQCQMNNLSTSGAFFEVISSYNIPKQGDIVRATIKLGKLNKSYVVYGQVVWSRSRGLGVNFIKNGGRQRIVPSVF